jgi:hypothetical protein
LRELGGNALFAFTVVVTVSTFVSWLGWPTPAMVWTGFSFTAGLGIVAADAGSYDSDSITVTAPFRVTFTD